MDIEKCPFCGKDAVYILQQRCMKNNYVSYKVCHSDTFGCILDGFSSKKSYDSEQQAIYFWNERVVSTSNTEKRYLSTCPVCNSNAAEARLIIGNPRGNGKSIVQCRKCGFKTKSCYDDPIRAEYEWNNMCSNITPLEILTYRQVIQDIVFEDKP